MKLLHPIMPSLTEEIWQALPHDGKTIMRTPWPEEQEELIDPDAEAQMTAVMDLVRAIRGMRADVGQTPGETVPLTLFAPAASLRALEDTKRYISRLARSQVTIRPADAPRPAGGISALSGEVEASLSIDSKEAAQAMRARLQKQLAAVMRDLATLEGRLRTAEFIEKAPAEVVEADQRRRDELSTRRATLERYMGGLGS